MKKTEGIQSLADQVEKLEDLQARLEMQEDEIKGTKAQIQESVWRHHTNYDV